MKPRLFLTASLLAVLLAACASPQATQPPAPSVEQVLPSATAIQPVVSADLSATPNLVVEAPTQTPFPIATSRGPELEATDPTTVSMASGGLQFIEFFEFW